MLNNTTSTKKSAYLSILGMCLFCLAIFMALFSSGISKTETPYFTYILIVLFFAGLFLYFSQDKKQRSIKGGKFLIVFFMFYSLWLIIEPYTSTWFDISRLSTWILFLTPISFYITSFIKLSKYQLKICFVAFIGSGLFLFTWSILHFIVARERSSGPTQDANVFAGLLLVFIIPITVYWLTKQFETKKEKRQSDFILLYLCFGYLGFYAAHSRSATWAFIIVGLLFFFKVYKDGLAISFKRKSLPILFVVITSFAVISWFSNSNFASMTRDLSQDVSSQLRLGMWKTGINIYKDNNKLTGIGFSQFSEFYARNRPASDTTSAGFHAHSDYIQFLVEGGLIQLGFFAVLAIYIIFNSLRLFLHKSLAINDNMIAYVVLSLCGVFFMQANVNFIFYVAPIAILFGILLACFNRIGPKEKIEIFFVGKTGFGVLLFSIMSLVMFLINLCIGLYFYTIPADLSQKKYDSLFKQSQMLSVVSPRALSLPHYNLKYQLAHIAKDDYRGDLDKDFKYVDDELTRAIRNKKYDADTVKFLAKYSFDHPKVFEILKKRFPSQKLYSLTTEQLYLLSIEYNPLIFGSFLELRDVYIEKGDRLKAYKLFKEGMVEAPNYPLLFGYFKAKSVTILVEDAIELGLEEDVKEYAQAILEHAPCFEPALTVMKRELPEGCEIQSKP